MNGRLGMVGAGLLLGGVLLIGAGVVLGGGVGPASMMETPFAAGPSGMMGANGGMMGGYGNAGATAPGPGEAGFVAGTVASPRVVRLVEGVQQVRLRHTALADVRAGGLGDSVP